MATKAFTISAVQVGATVIHQIQDSELDPGIEALLMSGDGAVYNAFSADAQIAPVCRFTSTALKTALDACGVAGLKIDGDTNFLLYFQQYADGGTREGVSKHVKLTVVNGFLAPVSVTADNRSASITYQVFAIFDGTNDPVQKAINQSLPEVDEVDEGYVVGPVYVNGAAVGSIVDTNIDFGLNVEAVQVDGLVYPDMSYVNQVQPSMRSNTHDLDIVDTIGINGIKQSGTGSESDLFLRALDDEGTRKAGTGSSHIKFTQRKGKIKPGGIRGSHGGRATFEIIFEPTYDATNAPITINTASAIG